MSTMKGKLVIIIGIVLFGAIVISSCEDKVALTPLANNAIPSNCDTAHLTYSGGIDTIINTQCNVSGCHDGKSRTAPNLTTYSLVMVYASGGKTSKFYTCLFQSTPYVMPNVPQPGWSSNPCLKAKLQQWLIVGAPQ